MRIDLADLPRYSSADQEMDAALYNRVRIALRRLGNPLRFPLPLLRHLDMILDEETWIVVDASLNDMPVMAWLEFHAEHREALHTPIPCRLYTYHCHADVIRPQVLETVADELARRLEPHSGSDPSAG
jgi:hypothetical protein